MVKQSAVNRSSQVRALSKVPHNDEYITLVRKHFKADASVQGGMPQVRFLSRQPNKLLSSKGRTPGFDPDNTGSNPFESAKIMENEPSRRWARPLSDASVKGLISIITFSAKIELLQ